MGEDRLRTPAERCVSWAALLLRMAERAPQLLPLARRYPAITDAGDYACYQSNQSLSAHYVILEYMDGDRVSVLHGADSNLPGARVFDFPAGELEPCRCGRWEWPSPEQTRATRARVLRVRDRLDGGGHGSN